MSLAFAQADDTRAAREVIARATGCTSLPLQLKIKKDKDRTYFSYSTDGGVLQIEGSDNVALCRGFYDFIKSNRGGVFTWSGNSICWPDTLPELNRRKVVSPFKNHYYFNVVTYGYSMPYWDWERWEKEIDWMALHGINMPLALVGYEAILARVWKKMGLTDDEINGYFVGPAHLPWMRMGNISSIDGPLNEDWYADQIALQHKILDRMRSLGMKPICPGFPGFIPKAFNRLYPDLKIVETQWGGAFHNWMIEPTEPLFSKITEEFIKEWEREFGKNDYYLVDSFNEMDIPFPEKGNPERYEMAANYGEKVYTAIKKANPNAVWAMQGWMFGYQRHIWDYETLAALVSKVPDDRMLLLDLAVDYNRHFWHSEVNWEYYKGFFGKQWIYSVIPNMGGKVGMTGVLDFYANGHLDALQSANRGNLIGHGMAPEGIENNEIIYELTTDAGWSDSPIDVDEWIENYTTNRYGKRSEAILSAYKHLRKSVYGTFTDHPRFNWQLRPGLVNNGTIRIDDDYFLGLERFAEAASELANSPLYLADLAEMTSHYLGGKAEILVKLIDKELLLGDTIQADFLRNRFLTLLQGMDILLSHHPTLRLDRWLGFAASAARNEAQEKQYLTNARRIVTVWGPPVDDYSARIWSGLIGNYYLPRWKKYYEGRFGNGPADLAAWELAWVEDNHDASLPKAEIDVVKFATKMIDLSKDISADDIPGNGQDLLGTWSITSGDARCISLKLSADKLKRLKGFTLESLKGSSDVELIEYRITADGKEIASGRPSMKMTDGKLSIDVTIPDALTANNGCELSIKLASGQEHAAGIVVVD